MLNLFQHLLQRPLHLRSTAARRLAQNAPLEHFDGLQPSLPKFGMTTDNDRLVQYYKTFRSMTKIEHTNQPLPENQYFCVNLKVKQRYINPLVGGKRLSDVSEKARRIINDFKSFSDTAYGCVKLI